MLKFSSPYGSKVPVLFVFLTLAMVPVGASAALDAYAIIQAATQGTIQGSVDVEPHVGKIRIKGFGSSVSADFDMSTGLPSGGQQHRPVRLLKLVDKASPLLQTVLNNNETLTSVILEFYRPTDAGAEEHFYSVELLNAHIVSILPNHSSVAGDSAVEMNETISLTYESMTVTWHDGGITSAIAW